MNSSFLKLNVKDLLKGFIVAVFAALLTGVYNAIQTGISFTWAFWQPIVLTAVGAGLAYLIKNLFSNSDGMPLSKEIKP